MLEKLVNIRRYLRIGKNFLACRSLEKSEHIEGRLADLLVPYIQNSEIKIFGFDNKDRAHIFKTESYSTIIQQAKTIETNLGMTPTRTYYQKFSGKKSNVHYFDVDYENKNHNLRIIARIKEYT